MRTPALLDDAGLMIAVLGEEDRAFGLHDRLWAGARDSAMFVADLAAAPALAVLRRDPRHLWLMAHDGLAQFWRSLGQWPDFCGEAQLPYRCPAAAEAALQVR